MGSQSEQSPESIQGEVEEVRDSVLRSAERKENVSLSLEFEEDITISVDGENNIISVKNPRETKLYPEDWQLINGTTLQGTSLGEGEFALDDYDRQSVIAARSLPDGSSVYHIEFREMRSDKVIELIDIKEDTTVGGTDELSIQYQGRDNETVGSDTGERLSRITTQILITSG